MAIADQILILAFLSALTLFLAAALVRALVKRWQAEALRRETAAMPPPLETPLAEGPGATPPPLPAELQAIRSATPGVSTRPYLPIDLLGIGVIFAFFFGLQLLNSTAKPSSETSRITLDGLIVGIAFQLMLAGIVCAWMVRRIKVTNWLGFKWPKWYQVLWIGPAGVVAMIGVQVALRPFSDWVESTLKVDAMQETVKLLQNCKDPLLLGLMAFSAVVVAPLCEETVFRGYLYPAAKRFAGPQVAAVFSGLVFAAAHGHVPSLLPLFILGAGLSAVYEYTGSLWGPIAVHCCFNGTTVLIQALARIHHLPLDPIK